MAERTKVLILGQEGYIGTALTGHLDKQKYEIRGIDNGIRSKNVASIGSESLMPKKEIGALNLNVNSGDIFKLLKEFKPDAIVHLAEQPSAPFSMKDSYSAVRTQKNNIIGTLNLLWAIKECAPNAHLIKIGTEGEYPDWLWDRQVIPEGNRIKVNWGDKDDWEIPTPRYAGSWYHWSKVHDSMNIDYACRIWGLKATDVNQGIVYGHINETRLDYDQYFGTVVNRFVVQAVAGMPLTVYGTGKQTRGFIPLQNSVEALELLINNEPMQGQFRVIHQTTDEKTVNQIAEIVQKVTGCEIDHIKNPRAEAPECEFTFDTSTLNKLGLQKIEMEQVIRDLVKKVELRKDHINLKVINPTTKWN